MSKLTKTSVLPSLDSTMGLGRLLGARLFPGSVVALVGPLGAGKTHFVRAIAEGLEVEDSRLVTSPTFVLIQEYKGRLPIYHFDAYRLQGEAEFLELGAHEYLANDGVCLIEWADRVEKCLPQEHLRIDFSITGETSRTATLQAIGEPYTKILNDLV
ncbi:MAG: tRNA (adenosine(37)-N6)-threonylcarbamoyltransferase complex ATPase subunit type 1 TsaE [Gemmataceae bacterium]